MHFSVAVFDLDGVIVSTDTFHFEAWKRLFAKRWGIIHTSAAEELTKGVARFECMKLLAQYYGLCADEEELRRAAEEKTGSISSCCVNSFQRRTSCPAFHKRLRC